MQLELEALTDEELAVRAQAGDMGCFEALVGRCGAPLFAFLAQRTLNRHDAEDLVQEAFVRAHQHLHRYDPRLPFLAWLYTIARRLSISHYRAATTRERAVAQAGMQAPPAETSSPADEASARGEAEELWALARRHLPERQFTALWLMYEVDLSVRDIAKAMGLLTPHVKVLLHRARRTLHQHLLGREADRTLPLATNSLPTRELQP